MKVNANVLKRFVIYMAILTFVMFTVWALVRSFMNRPPGDYETEVCDMRLKDKLYDKAIQAADIALEKTDTLEFISQILKGYHQAFHLNEYELNSVIFLMCLRLCITITMAAYRKKLFPENAYLSVSENQAWEFLNKMKNEDLNDWSRQLTEYAQS